MKNYPMDFEYLHGKPNTSATIRSCNEDFRVSEIPAFEPEGTGEHWFIKIRKNGENSDWIAKQLMKFCDVESKDVGYAGKKDRHAITEQWFSVCKPGQSTFDWQLFNTPTITVLDVTKHSRKLRTGALKGNRFELTLRDVSDEKDLISRLDKIKSGVPNYFGEQRFGIGGGNIPRGIAMLNGEFKEKNRTKKGLYISAVRSWFFNRILSNRIKDNMWLKPIKGDVMMLAGSHSHFSAEDLEDVQQRVEASDIHITGPLLGRGRALTLSDAQQWEAALLEPFADIIERLEYVGLKQERRSLRLIPENLSAVKESEGQWLLSFDLPAGSFATSVLREICQYQNGANS